MNPPGAGAESTAPNVALVTSWRRVPRGTESRLPLPRCLPGPKVNLATGNPVGVSEPHLVEAGGGGQGGRPVLHGRRDRGPGRP